jgi:predicted ATPase/DNA-binding XRE family transcriptional regulator
VSERQEVLPALFRRLRKAAGLSQEELAERAGVSVRSVTNIESGATHLPRTETLQLLAEALELTGGQHTELLAAVRAQRRSRAQRHSLALGVNNSRHATVPPVTHTAPLPTPLTPLIGRDHSLAAVIERVSHPSARLVTLTGLGGVGKTRLALAAAAALKPQFAHGVTVVALAAVREPSHVIGAIAEAVGAYESPTRSLNEALRAILASQRRLLLLDNFEHVTSAAPALTTLLEDCPQLTFLVTSRAPLRVRGEQVVEVAPLPLPPLPPAPPGRARRGVVAQLRGHLPQQASVEAEYGQLVRTTPSVALFLSYAHALRSDTADDEVAIDHIAAMCRHLDGLPLAIELAAATVRTQSPATLLSRIDELLDVLSGTLQDLPERQQSLRAALAWSYDLLPASSQALFRRLAVCVGGCSLALARLLIGRETGEPSEEVEDDFEMALDPILDGVLAHHLAWQDEANATEEDLMNGIVSAPDAKEGRASRTQAVRIFLLETVRAFAAEQLQAAGEEHAMRATHARHFLAIAEAGAVDLKGSQQHAALLQLDQERPNLYAALEWYIDMRDNDAVLRLVSALGLYWELRGLIAEGRAWFERTLALADELETTNAATTPEPAVGEATRQQHLTDAARGQREGRTPAHDIDALALRARALNGAGSLAAWQGDYPVAQARLEEALAIRRGLGDTRAIAVSLNNLGGLPLLQGDYRRARTLWEETLRLRQEVGEPRGIAMAQLNCGIIAHRQGRGRQAHTWLVAADAGFQSLGDQAMRALALAALGETLRQLGDATGATSALQEGLKVARSVERANAIILSLSRLAELSRQEGHIDEGLDLCDEALALAEEQEELREAVQLLLTEGGLWLECDEMERARACIEESQELCDAIRYRLGWAKARCGAVAWRWRMNCGPRRASC